MRGLLVSTFRSIPSNPNANASITRGGKLADAWNGLQAAIAAGFERVKINCVLIGGENDDEIADFVALTRTMPVDVRFIELMPHGGVRALAQGSVYQR